MRGDNEAALLILAYLMWVGYAMVLLGFSRARHAGSLLSLLGGGWMLAVLLYWAVGGALESGATLGGWVGRTGFFDWGRGTPWLSILAVTLTGSIVVGSVAERVRFGPALLVLALWVGVGVPVLHHWFTPSGWATRLGVSDPLGGIRIHFVGGAAAAVATWRVGPRYGRFTREGLPNALPAHNLPVSYLGALLFVPGWAGWAQIQRPELPASELLEQGLLALAAAGMTATFYAWFRFGKPDIPLTINGLIAGLVGVSCGLGHFSSLAALLVGIGSGVLVVLGTVWLDRLRLDDPGGVVPMHGLAGLWGALAVGLLHREEGLLLGGGPRLLLVQALISAAIGVLSAGMALLSLVPFLRWGRLRATEEEQITGLDAVEHGNDAYADFQRVEFK